MRTIFFIVLLCSAVFFFSKLDQPEIDKYINHIRHTFNQGINRKQKPAVKNQQAVKVKGLIDSEQSIEKKVFLEHELPETGKNNNVLNHQYDLKKEFNADKGIEKELEKQPEMKIKQDHYQLIWENLKEAGEILNELHDQASLPARTFSSESENQAMIKKTHQIRQ